MTNATTITLITALLAGPQAAQGEPPEQDTWQKRRLFNPTPGELAQERKGGVMIYEGLKGSTVERAMAENFDRIEHMMFLDTKETGTAPATKQDSGQDSDADQWIAADDGC